MELLSIIESIAAQEWQIIEHSSQIRRKVRIPEITALEALVQSCPARLRNHVGPGCTEERALQLRALVINGS